MNGKSQLKDELEARIQQVSEREIVQKAELVTKQFGKKQDEEHERATSSSLAKSRYPHIFNDGDLRIDYTFAVTSTGCGNLYYKIIEISSGGEQVFRFDDSNTGYQKKVERVLGVNPNGLMVYHPGDWEATLSQHYTRAQEEIQATDEQKRLNQESSDRKYKAEAEVRDNNLLRELRGNFDL